jgi:predicted esterase
MRTSRLLPSLLGAVLGATLLPAAALAAPTPATAAPPDRGHCAREGRLAVPDAEVQETACLDDLTTAGTLVSGHTNQADWNGLHAAGTRNPTGVPGIQVDGYFPDSSTANTNNGWDHDSQFVVRLPDDWNGKVVVTGAPGTRAQYANDFIIGDWVLAQGYAFASTDKGNVGTRFYDDGSTPGGSVREWNRRVTQLTRATRAVVTQRYGTAPRRTYMMGISNGGYLTRWQLENRPRLYDGGVDWEGTLFRAQGPNLLTYLPTALKHYPAYAATGSQEAHDAMIDAGFEEGSEFLWPFHHTYYWDLTQRIYREEFDPTYDGALDAGVPYCASGTPSCDADYDYASRPRAVKEAMRSVQLTGDVKRPLITLHGTLDALLPIRTDSDVYDDLVARRGHDADHRYYTIEDGTHTDGLYSAYPDRLRPLLPCARASFTALDRWVSAGQRPPADGFRARPAAGDLVNDCAL